MRDRRLLMTRLSISLCLAVALPISAFAQNGSSGTSAEPKLVIQSSEHDFGKVKEGEEATYTFKVKNEGNAELVIVNVSPACGCTASEFSKSIAPGKEGSITLVIRTAGMSGKVSRYADVISNDKKQANLKLWLHLEVQKTEHD